jgi:hypothetical protein
MQNLGRRTGICRQALNDGSLPASGEDACLTCTITSCYNTFPTTDKYQVPGEVLMVECLRMPRQPTAIRGVSWDVGIGGTSFFSVISHDVRNGAHLRLTVYLGGGVFRC